MFNEREALRLRLEQLNDKEIIVIRELIEKNEKVFIQSCVSWTKNRVTLLKPKKALH